MSSTEAPPVALEEVLAENRRLQERLDAALRLNVVLDELRDLGPASEILERAPAAAAGAAGLERVVLSRVEDGSLIAEAVFVAGDPAAAAALLSELQARPVRIEYPLVEGEVLRRRKPQLIEAASKDLQGRAANVELLNWEQFLIAPVILDGRVIAFLHGDRAVDRPLGQAEEEALWAFTKGFVAIFERAILRHRLRVQRREMRQIASWADAKTSALSDRAIDFTTDRDHDSASHGEPSAAPEAGLRDLLTRREIDVLKLMVKGETNAGIARALVVSEGTVKFHVKNILRKLHASNRAEATSRYLRLTLGRDVANRESDWPQ
ncbi:MAG TPA: LuxR C-terminal-related transcriptional regulator [Baekduia sp.]|nr:LuxR C-terminal-related transcriptional regulator [Baekduia sp.]